MAVSVGYSCGTNHEKEVRGIFKSRLERALIDSNSRPAEPPIHGLYCQPEATRTSRVSIKVEYEELWGDLLDLISTDLFQMATVTCGPAPRDVA